MTNRLLNVAAKAATGPDSMITRAVERLPEMEVNVGQTERVLSMVAGGMFLAHALTAKHGGILSMLAGGALLYRGMSGNCQMYKALGIDTADTGKNTVIPAGQGIKVDEAVVVHRSAEELYDEWRDLESLPQIMNHLREVKPTSDYESHWVAEGPLGVQVEWDAEITNDTKGEVIAWRSKPGSDVSTAGSVRFRELGEGEGTEVRVNLKFDPPAGALGVAVSKLLGVDPRMEIQEDLERFRERMEAGGG